LNREKFHDGNGSVDTAQRTVTLLLRVTFLLKEKCRTRTVERSKGCDDFDDEKPQPKLGNLATHTRQSHPAEWEGKTDSGPAKPIDQGYTAASAKLMESFLEDGKINPATYPTKKGFLKHFAAWILEDDLPFTTGETPGIKQLFHYLKVTYALPSDTTVRNQLARIYIHLHGEVVTVHFT
jgi:hypothetical protein